MTGVEYLEVRFLISGYKSRKQTLEENKSLKIAEIFSLVDYNDYL